MFRNLVWKNCRLANINAKVYAIRTSPTITVFVENWWRRRCFPASMKFFCPAMSSPAVRFVLSWLQFNWRAAIKLRWNVRYAHRNSFATVPCVEPCQATLSCSHRCSGTCATCRAGQLHIPCREKCTREMLCSHVSKHTDRINERCFVRCSLSKRLVRRVLLRVRHCVKLVVLIRNATKSAVNPAHVVDR